MQLMVEAKLYDGTLDPYKAVSVEEVESHAADVAIKQGS
jgi:hypothetical protein